MANQSTGNNIIMVNGCKQRDNYFDFLRGVAIMMVIGIHSYTDGLMHLNLFLRQFLNCAVPIFLAISGYFIGSKSFQERNSYFNFLRKQIPRVYVPMLLWSIPWFVLDLYRGNSLVLSAGRVVIGEMGMEIFYFIILIIQFYLLTPVIQKVNKYANGGGYAVLITLIGIMLFDYIMRIKGQHLPLVATAGLFPVWMIFYVVGVLKGQNIKMPYLSTKPLCFALAAIVLCCIHMLILHNISGKWVPGIKLSSHIYSYFLIMWLFSDQARNLYERIEGSNIVHHLIRIGKCSFFIYLTHNLFLYAYNCINLPSVWLFRFVLGATVSYVMAILFNRISPKKYKKYIGF